MLDGKETGEAYEEVGHLALAADGSHVGLFARREGSWRPSIDGLEVLAPGGAYEHAVADVTFDSQNSFHGFAVRAGTLYRVDVAR